MCPSWKGEMFLEFAFEVGAIDREEQKELERRSGRALEELGVLQAKYQEASDPALRFIALLHAALLCGRAHVADRRGKTPAEPSRCGWQCQRNGRRWVPQGLRIGWVAGSDLFLEPAVSYQVAQQLAGASGLTVSEQTLRSRLRERGLLVSTDLGRQMLTVRRTLEGYPRQVLHFLAGKNLVEQVGKDYYDPKDPEAGFYWDIQQMIYNSTASSRQTEEFIEDLRANILGGRDTRGVEHEGVIPAATGLLSSLKDTSNHFRTDLDKLSDSADGALKPLKSALENVAGLSADLEKQMAAGGDVAGTFSRALF